MNKIYLFFIFLCAIISGLLLFAFKQEYILIRLPQSHISITQFNQPHIKKICFYYWHHQRWQQEYCEIFWNEYVTENIQRVINHWLSLLEDRQLLNKSVQATIALSPQESLIYCSFNHSPFAKKWTIFEKWMIIEGILKTVLKAEPTIVHCMFLLRHQPFIDAHLDFSQPWPISGFLALNCNN